MRDTMYLRCYFKGNPWEFLLYNIGWGILIIITFGLAIPLYFVWMIKWICINLRIKGMIDLTKKQE